MNIKNIFTDLQKLANPQKAKILQRFFKTGKGEYGEGDKFLGLTVPEIKKIAKEYQDINLKDLQILLKNKIHEYRLCALIILRFQYEKSQDEKNKEKIVNFYLKNTRYINNWDLVDVSSSYILGNCLLDKNKEVLYKLARSKNLWERRIAIVSTFEFIRNNQFKDTLKICKILLNDKHDLIHRACGWMLREVGKRDKTILMNFLKNHHKNMPRTMFRYAIEKLENREVEIINKDCP